MRRAGLEVWLDEHEVGWLRPVGTDEPGSPQGLSFAYLARWTGEVLAYPLAPSLPLPALPSPPLPRPRSTTTRTARRTTTTATPSRRS